MLCLYKVEIKKLNIILELNKFNQIHYPIRLYNPKRTCGTEIYTICCKIMPFISNISCLMITPPTYIKQDSLMVLMPNQGLFRRRRGDCMIGPL